ncbi:MAG TPA: SRPBCC family protein [Ktedonobacterales bacterium]|jgi:carbon monoxide dehydrogenase subunit G
MELSGSQNFSASPQAVWDALHNPATLQNAAGLQNVQWSNNSLTATVTLPNLGPISGGARTVTVSIDESSAPGHMKMSLNRSIINASGTVDIAPNGDGSTLTYSAVANVSGPLSAFEGVAKPMVQSQISQFFAKFAQMI